MLVNYFGPRPSAMSADAFTNAQAGMQAGQAQVNQASSEIARAPLDQPPHSATHANIKATDSTGVQVSNLTRELINLHEGELVFKANARSIETAQSMFDSLLNMGRETAQGEQSSTAGEG